LNILSAIDLIILHYILEPIGADNPYNTLQGTLSLKLEGILRSSGKPD